MATRWVLQFCHSYYGPFLDVARQYAALFDGSDFKVLTVFLTGEPSDAVRSGSGSDEVSFMGFHADQIRGLKIRALAAFHTIAESREIAFVIAHRFKPIYIACCASKLPVLGVHHGFGDYRRLTRQCFARLFRRRLGLLGVSDAVRDDVRACLPDWPTERIETLYNRLDVEAVRARLLPRAEARAYLGLPVDGRVIGNVGRLHPDKDQATLIDGFARALPKLPQGTLLAIAGSGPLEEVLRTQAARLGVTDQVRFLGQITDIRRYFTAFDLFVLSSDHEPFGMVLLEAMVAGVPALATDCGGAPEVIGDAERLFRLRDSQALSDKLLAFFDGRAPRARREASCQRLANFFSDDAARRTFFSLGMVRTLLSGTMPRQ